MARPYLDESQVLEQRTRLVGAALKLYRTSGYEAVTLRSVAAKVGISHVTPYRYFGSKDELMAAARAQVFGEFRDFLRAADPGSADPRVRLWEICSALVRFGMERPDDYRLIFSLRQPALVEYPPLEAAQAQAVDHVVSVCLQAIDSGGIQGDPATLAHLAWGTIHGLISLHVSNQLVHGRTLEPLIDEALARLLGPDPRKRSNKPARARTRTPG